MCLLKQKPKRTVLFAWVMMWWNEFLVLLVVFLLRKCPEIAKSAYSKSNKPKCGGTENYYY